MLSDLKTRKLTKLFSMYDTQNTGVLQLSDFERIVHKLADLRGWYPGSPEYENLLNKYAYRWVTMRGNIKRWVNQKIGNKIHLDEWLRYHEMVQQDETYHQETTTLFNLLFDVIDLDNSGNLDRSEWKLLFQVFNIPVVYVEETFTKIDTNQDGSLSKEEVFPLLEEFYYSDDLDAVGNYIFGPF